LLRSDKHQWNYGAKPNSQLQQQRWNRLERFFDEEENIFMLKRSGLLVAL
jgi:hypothetical protein